MPRLWPCRSGCAVYTSGSVMNGPPSSGHEVIAGSWSRRTSDVTLLDHRARRHPPRAHPEQLAPHVTRRPQLARRRRQQRLRELDHPPHQPQRPLAERPLGARRRAEQVRDQRKPRALDVGEEQRRTTGGNHPPVDLGRFETRIDRRVDRDERPLASQPVDEHPEVRKRHGTVRPRCETGFAPRACVSPRIAVCSARSAPEEAEPLTGAAWIKLRR